MSAYDPNRKIPWWQDPEKLFRAWAAFVVLVALGVFSFTGWLAYLAVMHYTHG